MRLWSFHPEYLDYKGLGGVWYEGLRGLKVLINQGGGYYNHSQLIRFKAHHQPVPALQMYLLHIAHEANIKRGYNYDIARLGPLPIVVVQMTVTIGQLEYEFNFLLDKLKERDTERYEMLKNVTDIQPHPMFKVIDGPIAEWEKVKE